MTGLRTPRTLTIWLVSLLCTFLCQAHQTERVVMPQDTLKGSEVGIDTGYPSNNTSNFNNQYNQYVSPDLPEPVLEEGSVLEERPDSATIMSQTEFLLEQMHAGSLLFPSYNPDGDTGGKHAHPRFSHGLIAGSDREDLIGLMGIERGMLGYGLSYGPLSLQAYATADKYASFHNLTTVFGVGGTLTLNVTDWMSVTAFGAYYNKAPYIGMASYPYVNTSHYGGYMTFKPSGTFGMSVGVRRDYDPITRRYYTNPIVMPSIKIKDAVFSVDLGPVVNDIFQLFNRPKMPAGPMVPPGPRLLKPAGPLK